MAREFDRLEENLKQTNIFQIKLATKRDEEEARENRYKDNEKLPERFYRYFEIEEKRVS